MSWSSAQNVERKGGRVRQLIPNENHLECYCDFENPLAIDLFERINDLSLLKPTAPKANCDFSPISFHSSSKLSLAQYKS